VSTRIPLDVTLQAIEREPQTLGEWLVTFQMAAVVLDPYTHESAWILDTATRILRHFREADCRVVFIVAGTTDEARQFLGPLTEQVLTLCDADRALVKAAELEQLPAFVHLTPAGVLAAKAEGWDPAAWREVAVALAKRMSWTYPSIPAAGDPVAYPGSPAVPAA